MLRIALAAILLALTLAPASARTGGDAVHGGSLAKAICSRCHAIGPGGARSPNLKAPRFSAIALTLGMNKRALRVWMRTSHPTMPNYAFNNNDTDDIIAYILSLKPAP